MYLLPLIISLKNLKLGRLSDSLSVKVSPLDAVDDTVGTSLPVYAGPAVHGTAAWPFMFVCQFQVAARTHPPGAAHG